MIKVIAFDLFGTVFDPTTVDHNDIVTYVNWIRSKEWQHINRADLRSFWNAKPFVDSEEGLKKLQTAGYKIVAASNWQQHQIKYVSDTALIKWDFIVDFSKVQAFKPKLRTYALICDELGVLPSEVLFVTGNKGAGDDTEPQKIGMTSLLIRHDYPKTIIELSEFMEKHYGPRT